MPVNFAMSSCLPPGGGLHLIEATCGMSTIRMIVSTSTRPPGIHCVQYTMIPMSMLSEMSL